MKSGEKSDFLGPRAFSCRFLVENEIFIGNFGLENIMNFAPLSTSWSCCDLSMDPNGQQWCLFGRYDVSVAFSIDL